MSSRTSDLGGGCAWASSLSTPTLLVGLLTLVSCSQPAPAPVGDAIECALDGAPEFAKVCTLEHDGPQMIVHRPDGGFQRLEKIDGGVRPLDGADQGSGTVRPDGATELTVGGDRYRIPLSTIVP